MVPDLTEPTVSWPLKTGVLAGYLSVEREVLQ